MASAAVAVAIANSKVRQQLLQRTTSELLMMMMNTRRYEDGCKNEKFSFIWIHVWRVDIHEFFVDCCHQQWKVKLSSNLSNFVLFFVVVVCVFKWGYLGHEGCRHLWHVTHKSIISVKLFDYLHKRQPRMNHGAKEIKLELLENKYVNEKLHAVYTLPVGIQIELF